MEYQLTGTTDDAISSESDGSIKNQRKQKKKTRHHKSFSKFVGINAENKNDITIINDKMGKNQRAENTHGKTEVTFDRFTIELLRCRAITPPLRHHIKLNLPEVELISYLNHYLLNENDLKIQGYPYHFGSKAAFFKQRFSGRGSFCVIPNSLNAFDVNAREFIPTYKTKNIERKSSYDSRQTSDHTSSSSAPSTDSESSDNIGEWKQNERTGKSCVRCKRVFYVNEFGEYLQSERCSYHWGKYEYSSIGGKYSCCESEKQSRGCTVGDEHVWNGCEIGFNGPLDAFIRTENNRKTHQTNKVIALDCEMCYTGLGLECTKVTLVSSDGHKIYEKFVRPNNRIICYNTRFSGITKKHLMSKNGSVVTLPEVQQDLLKFIDAETILIGHALENDLRVLKIIHYKVIDTSVCFPHHLGPGFKHSLRTLTQQYLKRSIQDSDQGHSSFEDSRAALELMMWRVRRDFRCVLEKS